MSLHIEDSNMYLEHHGVLGMHWGVRRYQNADGSLTAAGRRRYDKAVSDSKRYGEAIANMERLDDQLGKSTIENAKKNNSQILTTNEFIDTYRKGVEELSKIEKELSKKYLSSDSVRKTMDDGYDYIVTYLNTDKIGVVEYYSLIGPTKK